MPISTNLYLDTRNRNKETQEYPVKISITKDGHTAYLPTGIYVKKEQWKERRIIGRPDKARLNDFIDHYHVRVRDTINEGRASGLYYGWSVIEVKNDVAEKMEHTVRKTKTPFLLSYFSEFASSRKSKRTQEIYRVTMRKIQKLFKNAETITLESIDLYWLESFDERLIAEGNNSSTRSIDFRNLKAVINDAVKHKIIKENPFDLFKIPQGDSPNRYLTIEQIRTLKDAKLADWQEKYRDFFLLSFYLMGINTEDLLHIQAIEEGRIDYVRAKTGARMSVKVEPEAEIIIEKYKGKDFLLNVLDTYKNTHNWTAKVDAELKRIAERLGLPQISMYWARHSWSTIAHGDLGIDIGTIGSALGHQPGKKVTMIYVRKKYYTNVDSANRAIIDYVFQNKKKKEVV